MDQNARDSEAVATFGAGCFWGIESEFRAMPGVLEATSGYAGGSLLNPTYEDVCTGRSGHTEVVEVRFDPSRVSYEALLDAFWHMHDPTQVDRQGPDVGRQYRSVIFYHSPEQRQSAEEAKWRIDESGRLGRPVATAIEPAPTFYRAEEYHQRYFDKQGVRSH